ncbi:MAG: response regulator [Anaerolineales bacterium]|nr:response regulator [Anaerolineales bacterium]
MLDKTLKNAHILIVDDQEANIDLLVGLLEKTGYTDLKSTSDSRQVVTLFGEFQPDLILLDLMMPHLDGFQVMEELRSLTPPDSYLPILVLTADFSAETKRRALSGGAKDFLTKPFDLTEVALRVNNLLETRYLHLQQKNQNQALEEKVRKRTEALQQQYDHIAALHKIDLAITGSLDLNLILRVVLEQTKTELNVDAATVLLLNPHTQILEFAAGLGFRSKAIERSRLRLGEGYGGRAALERKTMSSPNLIENTAEFIHTPLIADEGLVTYFGAPLIAKGQVKGVLEVFHRTPFTPDQNWLDFLEILAGQTAVAVDSASLFTDLQHSNTELFNAYDSTIEGWSHALDLRDKETEGHTQRVTEITMTLARAAGITEEELVHVRRGALLHDIGKMGVPDHILLKPDKLTDEEWVAMRKHLTFAFELLSPIAYLRPALDIPYCHHEKWDGSGYPRGLKGEQIPLAARLFAVVDVWDALRSDRPYRQSWSKEKVIEHIKSLSGTHFDPKAVELFFNMMSEDKMNAGYR